MIGVNRWADFIPMAVTFFIAALFLTFSPKARWILKEAFRHPTKTSVWDDDAGKGEDLGEQAYLQNLKTPGDHPSPAGAYERWRRGYETDPSPVSEMRVLGRIYLKRQRLPGFSGWRTYCMGVRLRTGQYPSNVDPKAIYDLSELVQSLGRMP